VRSEGERTRDPCRRPEWRPQVTALHRPAIPLGQRRPAHRVFLAGAIEATHGTELSPRRLIRMPAACRGRHPSQGALKRALVSLIASSRLHRRGFSDAIPTTPSHFSGTFLAFRKRK